MPNVRGENAVNTMKRNIITSAVLAAVLTAMLTACGQKTESENPHSQPQINPIQQYVYIDKGNTLHTSLNCLSLGFEQTYVDPKSKGVVFVDTCILEGNFWFCPQCVDESSFERLCDIMYRNETYNTTAPWIISHMPPVEAGSTRKTARPPAMPMPPLPY